MEQQQKTEAQKGAVAATVKLETEPHAVRWAQRDIKHRFETEYSKWHWTTDASTTICGRQIMLISDGPALLPETHDDPLKVTCTRCRKILVSNMEVRGERSESIST
jgi:hypothetical protein